MTTIDFITQLFCCVDDKLTKHNKNQKQTQANLYPSEVITIALLFALKGGGNRPFYRWIENNYNTGLTRFVLFFVVNQNSSAPEERNVYSTR